MSGYGRKSARTHHPDAFSSFMPLPGLQQNVAPQMLPDPMFSGNPQHPKQPFPQPLATMTQLPLTISQQVQKRNLADVEFVNGSMPVQQHRDPTFYGLSASLPMSTYTTPLSRPPQTPNKRPRQSPQSVQRGSMATQRPLQASASHVNWSVASSRSRPVYRSQPMPSRHGYGPREPYRTNYFRQQPSSVAFLRSNASANPYMAERPPSWNWVNELHATGTTMDVLGRQYENFGFILSDLDNRPGTVTHLQSVQQGPGQTRQTWTQSNFQSSTPDITVSESTPDQSTVFHSFQATPETRTNSFDLIDNQMEDNVPTKVYLGPQGTEISWARQGSPPPQLEEVQWSDVYTGSTSVAEGPMTDLPHLSAFSVSSFENAPAFDHDFDFDFDFDVLSNTGGIGDAVVGTTEAARDSIDGSPSLTPNASYGPVLAEMLQPVASYLPSTGYDHTRKTADELAFEVSSESGGACLGTTHRMMSIADGKDSSSSMAELQSPVNLYSNISNAAIHLPNNNLSTNGLNKGCIQAESLLDRPMLPEDTTSNKTLSRSSTINSGTSASARATASTETGLSLSPAGHDTIGSRQYTSPGYTPCPSIYC